MAETPSSMDGGDTQLNGDGASTLLLQNSDTEALRQQFDFYQRLVALEFAGRSTKVQYELAFSRLLKPDPARALGGTLGEDERPSMLGADERDSFLPKLEEHVGALSSGCSVFDLGGGDGQTIALVADHFPEGTTFNIEEPNAAYVDTYLSLLRTDPRRFQIGMVIREEFDATVAAAKAGRLNVPPPASQDLCLAIHMIYFAADLSAALNAMIDFLRPGGHLFLVFADGINGFTGKVVTHYLDAGSSGKGPQHRERNRALADLFGLKPSGTFEDATGCVRAALSRTDITVDAEWQPTRLYGHDLGDLIALGFITGLAEIDEKPSHEKIRHVRDLIEHQPGNIGFGLELTGPRKGMWSVSEPQVVVSIKRADD